MVLQRFDSSAFLAMALKQTEFVGDCGVVAESAAIERRIEYLKIYCEPGREMVSCLELVQSNDPLTDKCKAVTESLKQWFEASVEYFSLTHLRHPTASLRALDIMKFLLVIARIACKGRRKEVAKTILYDVAGPVLTALSLPLPLDATQDLSNVFTEIAGATHRSVREVLFPNLVGHLRNVAARLAECGDYSMQQCLLVVIARMIPMEHVPKVDATRLVFSDELHGASAMQMFIDSNMTANFDIQSRQFLMLVNCVKNEVVHFISEKVVLDAVSLVGPNGVPGDCIYAELNSGTNSLTLEWNAKATARSTEERIKPNLTRRHELLRASYSNVISVVYRSEENKIVIDIQATGIAIIEDVDPKNSVSHLQIYPNVHIESIKEALPRIFSDKFKCATGQTDTCGLIKRPDYYEGRCLSENESGESSNNERASRSPAQSISRKRWYSVASYRNNEEIESSLSGASACELRSLLQNLDTTLIKKTAQHSHIEKRAKLWEPECDCLYEITSKVSICGMNNRSTTFACEEKSESYVNKAAKDNNEVVSIDLINDLHNNEPNGKNRTLSESLREVIDNTNEKPSIRKDSLKSLRYVEKTFLNNAVLDQALNENDKQDDVLDISNNSIEETPRTQEFEQSLSKENMCIGNEAIEPKTIQRNDRKKLKFNKNTDKSYPSTQSNKIKKGNIKKSRINIAGIRHLRGQVNSFVNTNDKNIKNLMNETKTQLNKGKTIESAAEGSTNSDAIPDTPPNVRIDLKLGNLSIKKTPTNRNLEEQNKPKNKSKFFRNRPHSRTSNSSSTNHSNVMCKSTHILNEIGNRTSPLRQRKKRPLYSPNADFIVQNSQGDETKQLTTNKLPYIVLKDCCKAKSSQNKLPTQKPSHDIFDQMRKNIFNDVLTNDTTKKDDAIYNISDSDDSATYFQKTKITRRSSNDISTSAKTHIKANSAGKTKNMTRVRKINKVKNGDKSTNLTIPELILEDERMRKETTSLEKELNTSFEVNNKEITNDPDVDPVYFDKFEMEHIPEEPEIKSMKTGHESLKPKVKDDNCVESKPMRRKAVKVKTRDTHKKVAKPIFTEKRDTTPPPPLVIERVAKNNEDLNIIITDIWKNIKTPTNNIIENQMLEEISKPGAVENEDIIKDIMEVIEDDDKSEKNATKKVKRSCITLRSTPEKTHDEEEIENYIPTDADSPINAHCDPDEEPPQLGSLDATDVSRDLETENLNSANKSFIRKLRSTNHEDSVSENQKVLRSTTAQVSTDISRCTTKVSHESVNVSRHEKTSASESVNLSHCPNASNCESASVSQCEKASASESVSQRAQKKHHKTIRSTMSTRKSRSCKDKLLYSFENMIKLSPVKIFDDIVLRMESTNIAPAITTQSGTSTEKHSSLNGSTQASYSQSVGKEKELVKYAETVPKQKEIQNTTWMSSAKSPTESTTLSDMDEIFQETIEKGIRESYQEIKTKLVSVVANHLTRCEEASQQFEAECEALLSRCKSRKKSLTEELKSSMLELMRELGGQSELRVSLAREDVASARRRYRPATRTRRRRKY